MTAMGLGEPDYTEAPAEVVRAQGGYLDIWGPDRRPIGVAQRWLREQLSLGLGRSLGQRFADPRGRFVETYAATKLEGALVEIWAWDVPDEATVLAARAVHQASWDAPFDPDELPSSSYEGLFVWTLQPRDRTDFLDVSRTATRTWLRRAPELRGALRKAGAGPVLASGLVEGDGPRSRIVTQAIAALAYRGANVVGIGYRSRYGDGEENWAIFDKTVIGLIDKRLLDPTEPAAIEAARRLGLYISAGATP